MVCICDWAQKNKSFAAHFFFRFVLTISVSKTKAIWFGKDAKNMNKLCPDLNLNWDTQFKLLGVEFDNDLDNMDSNFALKLDEMKKVLDCWIYRSLTVYGKITVIKSLVLSKVSHLALVLPNLNIRQIRKIEKLLFRGIWGVIVAENIFQECKFKKN